MNIQEYIQYSDLFGERPSLSKLKKMLRPFKRENVIFTLCQINALLGRQRILGGNENEAGELQRLLANNFCDDEVMSRIKSFDPDKKPVFFRRQVLFLLRHCILECSSDGSLVPHGKSEAAFLLGRSLLIASDHLVSIPDNRAASTGTAAKQRRQLSLQLAPTSEFENPISMTRAIARTEILFQEMAASEEFKNTLPKNLREFDIGRRFVESTGITLRDYCAFNVAVLSLILGVSAKSVIEGNSSLTFDRAGFIKLADVTQSVFDSYLTLDSKDADGFESYFSDPPIRVSKSFSFALFRNTPLIEVLPDTFVCVDPCFLVERLGAGTYWQILDSLKGKADKNTFLEFYGYLFERYVNEILGECAQGAHFIPNPIYDDKSSAFDAILYYPETKHLIVVETKASFMRADAKYSGKARKFESELKKKFVRKQSGAAKGVGQLADHISKLFARDTNRRKHLRDVDAFFRDAEKISPVLVVQDSILRFSFVEQRLNWHFSKLLKKHRLRQSVRVNQLAVIDIDILEKIKPHLVAGAPTLEQCLNSRAHLDPRYLYPSYSVWHANFTSLQSTLRNERLDSTYHAVMNRTVKSFFGQDLDAVAAPPPMA